MFSSNLGTQHCLVQLSVCVCGFGDICLFHGDVGVVRFTHEECEVSAEQPSRNSDKHRHQYLSKRGAYVFETQGVSRVLN